MVAQRFVPSGDRAGNFITGLGQLASLLLRPLAHISLLDAYLATTPGGLYAVLAAAFGTGADTTFVIAVQTLRLFVMILLAPLVVRWVAAPR